MAKATRKQPKKPAKLGWVATMAASVSVTGIDVEVVKAAKNSGCPAFHQSGRVNCDALVSWLAERPEFFENDPEGKPNKALEEALLKRADRRLREHRLSEVKKKSVSRSQVATDWAVVAREVREIIEDEIQSVEVRNKIYAKLARAADKCKL